MGKDKPVLTTVSPPWHSMAVVGTLLALSISNMPTLDSIDKIATVDTFTKRLFPGLVTLRTLGVIRLLIAISIWITLLYMMASPTGWDLNTNYRPQSKLKNTCINMSGFKTLCPFTSWCWILLGLYFSFGAVLALMVDSNQEHLIQPWMLRLAFILWELAAPFALLVSAVVRYAIWPVVLAGGKPHTLDHPRNQMMHNMNSVFSLSEAALLGGLPIHENHWVFPVILGVIYITFSWNGIYFYRPKEDGPQFIYWFLDVTLGKTTTIALIALVLVLITSFGIFIGVGNFLDYVGGGVFAHAIIIILISSMVCRVRA